MKNWSTSTKVVVLLVVVLIGFLVYRQVTYARMAHMIAHQLPTDEVMDATRRLVRERKLARVFKDGTDFAKLQAIEAASLLVTDTSVVEIEGHHMPMAQAASSSLVEFLSDLELPVREHAAEALGRMGKYAARPLLDEALNSPNKDVRNNATTALEQIGLVAVPEMIDAVNTGKPTVKVGAATALGNLRTPRAVPALIGALAAKEEEVRLTARDALVTIAEPSVEPLIAALTAADPFTRQHSAEALGEIGETAAAEPLVAVLDDSHRLVRLAATYAVGKLGDPVATVPLIAKLEDADREIREAAAVSLGQIEDPRATDDLIAVLEDDVEGVREQAAIALGRIRPQDAEQLNAIIRASGSPRVGTRLAAVFALGQIGDPRTVPAVSQRLASATESSDKVRRRAALALGTIGSQAAIQPLVNAFADPDWRVNYAAQEALAAVGEPAQATLLELMGSDRPLISRYARMAVVQLDPPPVDRLGELLRSGSDTLRLNAALALADIGSDPALELLRTVALQDESAGVRTQVERALKARGAMPLESEGNFPSTSPGPSQAEPPLSEDEDVATDPAQPLPGADEAAAETATDAEPNAEE